MLVTRCTTAYSIWNDPACSDSEAFAAEELSRYLNIISGANFALLRHGEIPDRAIVVGNTPKLQALGIDLAAEDLGDEGFIIRTIGERLIIAGGAKRGTLYGVYEYLESVMGVRWYTESAEHVPTRTEIEFAPLDIKQVPALEYRETFYPRISYDGAWSAHNKNNGSFPRLSARQGGKISYYPFVHTFESILPVDENFDAHPEYYSMVDGVRIRERAQLCLTNPEVVQKTIEKVREWIQANPDVTIISVSQNDWYNPCQCPACQAIDRREGSHAGTLIHFVNQVAEAIENVYPHIVIDTLAYQYTRTPPKFIRPRPNVCVRLCSIECCFAHPLSECDRICSFGNRIHGDSFQADLAGWAKVCDRLYIWDYVVNFHHYVMPFPNFNVLGPNIRYFIENHVKGIFEEGATSPHGGLEFAELRAWVLAKLLWNPYQHTQPLVEDFIAGYYGKAAPNVLAYYNLLNRSLDAVPDAHFGIYDPPRVPYLTDAVLQQAKACFDRAENTADDPQDLERVRIARLPIRYWELLVMNVNAEGRTELIRAFEQDLISRSILEITEGRPLTYSIEQLSEGLTFRFPI